MTKPVPVVDRLGLAAAAPAFVIPGMHRSGTSALARVIAMLGADLPRTLVSPAADNPKGFWESASVVALNEELLAEFGSSWDDILAFLIRRDALSTSGQLLDRIDAVLSAEFDEGAPIVLKEPRLGLVLDPWLAALSRDRRQLYVIIPVRDPLEVAASLAARNGLSVGHSLLLWLSYFLAAEKSSRGTRRVFVRYADLLEDWRGAMRRVEEGLDVRFPRWAPGVEVQIDAFLSSEDKHHRSAPEQINVRGDVADWVKRSFAWANAAASGEKPDPAQLDAVAAEFTQALRIFAPALADHRATIALVTDNAGKAWKSYADTAADLERARAEHVDRAQQFESETHRLVALAAEGERRISALQTEIDAGAVHIDALNGALRAQKDQIEARDSALARLKTNIEAMYERLRDKDREADRLRRRLEEGEAARRVDERALSELEDAVQAITAKVGLLDGAVATAGARAEAEAATRTHFEGLANAQGAFLQQSMPFGRRARRALWRRGLLRPLSDAFELASGSFTRGPSRAMRNLLMVWRLRASGAFDADYYLRTAWDVAATGCDPIFHYVRTGATEGRDPSASFSTRAYLAHNPDVAATRANPLDHFVSHGRREGRHAAPAGTS